MNKIENKLTIPIAPKTIGGRKAATRNPVDLDLIGTTVRVLVRASFQAKL